MICPACNKATGLIVKCDKCGDTRCISSSCTGSFGNVKGAGSQKTQCRACRKGKYQKV
jgi:hypothetical protein